MKEYAAVREEHLIKTGACPITTRNHGSVVRAQEPPGQLVLRAVVLRIEDRNDPVERQLRHTSIYGARLAPKRES